MKDERFNNLMQRYVDSTSRGEDADLQKLKNKSAVEIAARRRVPKYVWAVCAVIIIAAVTLSIALPIALNKEDAEKIFYCDSSNTEEKEVKDTSEFKDVYGLEFMLPTVENIDSYMRVMSLKEESIYFGAFIDIAVFDENFDGITFNIIKKPYALSQLKFYDMYTDSIGWRNATVRYYKEADAYSGVYYSYHITFSIDGYNYFISFKSFSDMSIVQVLDAIYGETENN